MFTYVQSDDYCDKQEMGKTVTTSVSEQQHPLYVKLMGSAKTRQQVRTGGGGEAVTTLVSEQQHPLYVKLMGNAKTRQQVRGGACNP